MIRLFLKLGLLMVLSFSVFAQNDDAQTLEGFDGTWILDEKKSFRTSEVRENFEDYMLVISSESTAISIVKSYLFRGLLWENDIELFSDYRGETNQYIVSRYPRSRENDQFFLERVDLDSRTSLKKGKIIRKGTCNPPGMAPFKMKETYKLSKDRRTLTIKTEKTYIQIAPQGLGRNPSPFGIRLSPMYKLIFHKKD